MPPEYAPVLTGDHRMPSHLAIPLASAPPAYRAQIERSDRSYGFHIFRHTAGSIIYEKTGRMKLVQKALDHSREQTTSDIYVHIDQEVVAESMEIVAGELFADRGLFQGQTAELIN